MNTVNESSQKLRGKRRGGNEGFFSLIIDKLSVELIILAFYFSKQIISEEIGSEFNSLVECISF